jgi:dienelactone hydrolase
MRLLHICSLLAGALILVPACAAREDHADLLGAWRLDDGAVVTIAPSADDTWRYRALRDGSSGRLHPVAGGWQAGPGFSDRDPAALVVALDGDRLRWLASDAPPRHADRVAVVERDLAWTSGDARLRGRLVMPATPGPHPVVVLVHGSERRPAIDQWHDPYMLAAHGIAGLVYDKRGTGESGGEFSADFRVLAADAAAAGTLLASEPEIDHRRIGFAGFSQGGWVAPLASELFGRSAGVLVGYGMIDSPLAEDRWQCLRAVRGNGGDARDLAEAARLVDATHRLLTSDLGEGWPAFKAVVRGNRDRPWLRQLDQNACIGPGFAAYPAWVIRSFAGRRLPPAMDWNYASHALLAASSTPMLWLLAANDSEAIVDETAAALRRLAAAGKPYEVVVLEGAEHGMVMHRRNRTGELEPVGYHPDYFARMLAFWQQRFDT